MPILSKRALEGIAHYQYKPSKYTWLDKQLTPWWEFCARQLPLTMAPNLVTLVGTAACALSVFILNIAAPNLDEYAPLWTYGFGALCVFFYQTMDAIDGKQARRTKSSSPLGQLFDHGCDALCVVFNMIGAAACVRTGPTYLAMILMYGVSVPFYGAQWDEYMTGEMKAGNGLFGVTEGQLSLVAIYAAASVLGPDAFLWAPIAKYPVINIRNILAFLLVAANTILTVGNVAGGLLADTENVPKAEKGYKRLSKRTIVVPIMIYVLGFLWISGPGTPVYQRFPLVHLYTMGIISAHMSTTVIISHVAKVPCPTNFRLLLPLALVVANTYTAELSAVLGGSRKTPFVDLETAAFFELSYTVVAYLYYVVRAANEIAAYLRINILTISRKDA